MSTNKVSGYKSPIAIAPGETIQEVIADRYWTVEHLSEKLDLNLELTKGLLAGNVRIDTNLANRLEEVLEIPASFWRNLERMYNETLLRLWEEVEGES